MIAPDTETSTREERLEFLREEFKCLGNCPICGKCNFLRGRRQSKIGFIEDRRGGRCVSSSVIIILDELLVKWEL